MKIHLSFATILFVFLLFHCEVKGQDTGIFKPTAIDIGLSVKWGSANLGASSRDEYGDYYAWDEVKDAICSELSDEWRMPTADEIKELEATRLDEKYHWEWKTIRGHKGWEIFCLSNGNSIFLPVAGLRYGDEYINTGIYGYYWSCSIDDDSPQRAWYMYIYPGGSGFHHYNRSNGFTVRPVIK